MINGHNKNILIKQEKPSPCNCREKTSNPSNGSCQDKNLVYSCKVSTQDIKQNHRISLALQSIHLKVESANVTIISSKSQREIQQNFLISYGVKRKRRLMWILIGAFSIRYNLCYDLHRNNTFL